VPLFNQSGYGSGRYGLADLGPVAPLPISYYTDLLTSQYRLAPKLNAWLATELQPFADVASCTAGMTEAVDLDSAVGIQLDNYAGIHSGALRTVGFQPSDGVSPILDDDTYRILIKATIAANHWNGTISELYPIWATLFPGGKIVIIDNQNMSATILMGGTFSSIIQDLISHGYIVPRPQGVQYTYTFSNLPIFGFSTENTPYIAGFDVGNWS
jgi:hypothetical protein